MTLETTNFWLSLGTVALQAATVALLVLYVLRGHADLQGLASLVGRWGVWLALVFSFAGSALTLFYSEVLGIPPCPLCWIQRALLYPQILLFGFAVWQGTTRVALYSLVLSVAGAGVALYHHALQMFPDALPCLAEGAVCAQRHIFEFGYITFPLMSATLFAFLIVLMLFVRARNA